MEPLGICAHLALERGTRMLDPAAVEQACAEAGLDHDTLFAALVDLRQQGLVQLQSAEPSRVVLLAITNAGLEHHLRRYRPDLAEVARRLAEAATEARGAGPVDLARELDEPPLLVECILDRWVADRRIVYSKAPGRRFRIHRVLEPGLPGAAAAPAEPSPG